MTAHQLAHCCAAVPTPYAYVSHYFTLTHTLIISLSYVLIVYRLACKGHSRSRLGLLYNPRTINSLRAYALCIQPLKALLYIVSFLYLHFRMQACYLT